MGTRSESGLEIDVRSCFAVPHAEGDDHTALDMPFEKGIQALLNKNGTKEQIVGWYVLLSPTGMESPLTDMLQVRNAPRHQHSLGIDPQLLHQCYFPIACRSLDSRH